MAGDHRFRGRGHADGGRAGRRAHHGGQRPGRRPRTLAATGPRGRLLRRSAQPVYGPADGAARRCYGRPGRETGPLPHRHGGDSAGAVRTRGADPQLPSNDCAARGDRGCRAGMAGPRRGPAAQGHRRRWLFRRAGPAGRRPARAAVRAGGQLARGGLAGAHSRHAADDHEPAHPRPGLAPRRSRGTVRGGRGLRGRRSGRSKLQTAQAVRRAAPGRGRGGPRGLRDPHPGDRRRRTRRTWPQHGTDAHRTASRPWPNGSAPNSVSGGCSTRPPTP